MTTLNMQLNDKSAIQDLINIRLQAVRQKDIETCLSLFSSDIISYDVVNPLQFKGKATIRERLVKWFGSFDGNPQFDIAELQIGGSSDIAFYHCLNHVQAKLFVGTELDMWYRESTILQKFDNKWLIIHSHTSAPFNTQTGKASLNLKP